mgnify:CR=1 FL=1
MFSAPEPQADHCRRAWDCALEMQRFASAYAAGSFGLFRLELTGSEVATAIDAYLVAHGVAVSGPRTVTVNGELCESGSVYVDPSGFVIADGKRISGSGPRVRAMRRDR